MYNMFIFFVKHTRDFISTSYRNPKLDSAPPNYTSIYSVNLRHWIKFVPVCRQRNTVFRHYKYLYFFKLTHLFWNISYLNLWIWAISANHLNLCYPKIFINFTDLFINVFKPHNTFKCTYANFLHMLNETLL